MSQTPPPAPPAATPTAPMRRGLRILLVVSLALNLAVAGVIGGAVLAGRKPPGPFGGFDPSLGPFARALSRDDQRAIADEMRARAELRPQRRGDRREMMEAFLAALTAEPFDPGIIEKMFADQRDRALRGMGVGQELLLARIVAMTPSERAAFAEGLRHEMDHDH